MSALGNVNMGRHWDEESRFDGKLREYIGWCLVGWLITVCTLGICYPWSVVMLYRWKVEHTVVEGRRLRFDGSAVGLFGQWVKWFLLTLVTFGIYGFWVFIKLEQWKARHTYFQ